jgi:hypothetical protein
MYENKHFYAVISKCLFAIVILFLLACSNNGIKESSVTISGQLKYTSGMKIYFQELDLQDVKTLDSAIIDLQGKFRFICNSSDEGFYILKLQDGRFVTLLLKRGENVFIKGDLKRFPGIYEVSGSTGSGLLKEFYDHTTRNKRKGDSLMDILHTHQYASDYYKITIAFDTLFQDIWHDQRKFEMNFIDKNIGSLSSLLVLNYAFGPRPVLSEDIDFNYYLKVDNSMMKLFPRNKHVIYHHKRIAEYQRQLQVRKMEADKLHSK